MCTEKIYAWHIWDQVTLQALGFLEGCALLWNIAIPASSHEGLVLRESLLSADSICWPTDVQ